MDQHAITNGYDQSMPKNPPYPSAGLPPASKDATFSVPQFDVGSETFGAARAQASMPAATPPGTPDIPTQTAANTSSNVMNTTKLSIPEEPPTIEVEWVEKVSYIVKNTSGDPYNKSYQLGLLKSQYIESMYGKVIGEKESK